VSLVLISSTISGLLAPGYNTTHFGIESFPVDLDDSVFMGELATVDSLFGLSCTTG